MYQRSVILQAMLGASILAVAGAANHATADEPAHMSLVRQLGAASFAQRQSAAKKLIAIGVAAQPALIQAMEQDDLEIRLGAHRVLVQVLQNDFDARIAAFLDEQSPNEAHDLPGWQLFREEVGDDHSTRRLYADMLRAENDLIVALGRNDSSLEQMLVDRIQFLTSSRMIFNGRRRTISGPTLATILLVGLQSMKSLKPGTSVNMISPLTNRIYRILHYPATKQTVLQEAYSPQIKKLLAGWIDGIGNSREQHGWFYAMQLVLEYDLREQGPRVARKVLKSPGTDSSLVPQAAIVLGRFGTVEDAKYLEPHLGSTQVFHAWSNVQLKKGPIHIQVRDAVLAMTIRLHGEDPAAYGFKLLQADEQTIYKVYTFGFLEDSERDAAFAKWEARSKPGKVGEAVPEKDESSQEEAVESAKPKDKPKDK